MTGMTWFGDVWIDQQHVAGPDTGVSVHRQAITEGFLPQMKIPLLRGRHFASADDGNAQRVAIINEAMARRFWPGSDPLHRSIEIDQGGQRMEARIVGIVGNARLSAWSADPEPELYLPFSQAASPGMYLVLGVAGDPLRYAGAVKQALRSLEPDLMVTDIQAMDRLLADSMAEPRFHAVLLGLLAALAFLIACCGVYSVTSYCTYLRRHEIGVRMTLGARPRTVLALFLKQAAVLVGLGILGGTMGAAALTRVLTDLLFGVSPTDPAVFAASGLTMGVMALAACLLPSFRISRIDILQLLRAG